MSSYIVSTALSVIALAAPVSPADFFETAVPYGTDMSLRDPFGNSIRVLQQGK